MRRLATLAVWLLALVAGLGRGATAPNLPERKPGPASTKTAAVTKTSALASKPRVTKPLPGRGSEAGHRQVTTINTGLAPRPSAPTLAGNPPRPERTAAPARPSIEARIVAAREIYQAGRYAEVPTALIKLLTESQLTPSQLAAVYELLASAYVALGQTDLAIRCFSEVLSRRPAFALDPVRTSPKIRAALDQAQALAKPLGPGTPAAPLATRRPM